MKLFGYMLAMLTLIVLLLFRMMLISLVENYFMFKTTLEFDKSYDKLV